MFNLSPVCLSLALFLLQADESLYLETEKRGAGRSLPAQELQVQCAERI